MDPALQLHPGQQALTPAQVAEARRFAAERIESQLATMPVDEEDAEGFLWQAYAAAELEPPYHIHWVDGPLELVAALAHDSKGIVVDEVFTERVSHCVWDDLLRESSEIKRLHEGISPSVDERVRSVRQHVEASIQASYGPRRGESLAARVWGLVVHPVVDSVRTSVGEHLSRGVDNSFAHPFSDRPWDPDRVWDRGESDHETCRWHSMCAYDEAARLAYLRYFDTYAAPNKAHGLAHFNELVSGYWLGKQVALLVRHPQVLARDPAGRLHSETGKCIAYRDGWGCYAWHGVRVPERVILAPETLTREDFLREGNLAARRLMQRRMGRRFIWELGGRVINRGPRGTLYEVDLPYDPERVARYVRVHDVPAGGKAVVRVPPSMQTAAEAVAWSLECAPEEYSPAPET